MVRFDQNLGTFWYGYVLEGTFWYGYVLTQNGYVLVVYVSDWVRFDQLPFLHMRKILLPAELAPA